MVRILSNEHQNSLNKFVNYLPKNEIKSFCIWVALNDPIFVLNLEAATKPRIFGLVYQRFSITLECTDWQLEGYLRELKFVNVNGMKDCVRSLKETSKDIMELAAISYDNYIGKVKELFES